MKKNSQGKKLISFALVFALLISLFSILPLTASAAIGDTTVVDGVTYTVSDEVYGSYTATVTKFDDTKTDVVIKDKVNINGTDFTVTAIDKTAFGGNTKITSVNIPGTIVQTSASGFKGCTSLKNVTLNEGLETIVASTFSGCTSLEKIEFPSTVNNIYTNAFNGCTSLTELHLRNKDMVIDRGPFTGCTGLKKIYIHTDVEFTGNAFNGCTAIEDVYCYGKEIKFNNLTLAETNQTLIMHGYKGSTAETYAEWTNMNTPAVQLKKYAHKFEELKEEETSTATEATTTQPEPTESDDTIFTWKKVNEGDGLDGPIEITGLKEGKSATRDFEIPSVINAHPVTVIGESAFAKNTNIANLTIPSSVIVINNKAFYGISYLSSVKFAENSQLQKIGDEVFGRIAGAGDTLSDIELPETLKQIGYRAFYNRVNLLLVKIYSKDVLFGSVGKGTEVFSLQGDAESSLKLCGYKGSTTQTYAAENGHTFRYLDLNTEELQSLYDQAKEIDSKLYTAESYAVLSDAMKAAKKMLANLDAKPEEIEECIATLKAAIDGLVLAPTQESTEASTTEEATTATDATEASTEATEATTDVPETTILVGTIEVLLGDADGSQKVDVKDVTHIQKHIAAYFTLEGTAALAADVDGNRVIDVNDVTLVQKYLAAYNVDYKIGEIVQFSQDTPAPTADNPQPTDDQSTTAAPDPTTAEPEPTTKEPEPTESGDTTRFYIPNYVSWLDSDGCKMWLYNDDTDGLLAATEYEKNPDGIAGYFYFDLPNDWVNISIYRTAFEITEETFDKNSPWNEETKTGVILNSWVHIGDRGENNAYKIVADKQPGVFETFDPNAPKPDEDERTIYFDNSNSNWGVVYIYGWSFGLEKDFIAMEPVGNNIWSYTFYDTLPIDGVTGFLFVNQTDWNGARQTGDIATEAGKNLFIPSGSGQPGQKITGKWDVYTP